MDKLAVKIKIVKQGESKIFNNWHDQEGITEEDFIAGLRWLSEDPRNGGHLNRELGCYKGQLHHLVRTSWPDGSFAAFRFEDGRLWPRTIAASISDADRI